MKINKPMSLLISVNFQDKSIFLELQSCYNYHDVIIIIVNDGIIINVNIITSIIVNVSYQYYKILHNKNDTLFL